MIFGIPVSRLISSLVVINLSIVILNLLASDSGSPHFSRLETRTENTQVTNCSHVLHKRKKHKKHHKKHKSKHSSKSTDRQVSTALSRVTSACGRARPTAKVSVSSGPNGRESFLNCGIDGDGWKPAHVEMWMLETGSLDQEPALTTFAPCLEYRPLFEKYAEKYGIPPIFLAAFAMQESSCKPHVVGDNGGAFGLMQITQEKCADAPNGDCTNPDYNVKMGAKTFADALTEANGNVLEAIGGYNGWSPGLTMDKALEAKSNGCCACQQNLDYLHQVLNGWVQGLDPYALKLGTIRNLDVCGELLQEN